MLIPDLVNIVFKYADIKKNLTNKCDLCNEYKGENQL